MSDRSYPIKECFLSLQGEGMRAGEASVFLRFSGCNLKCRAATQGFDCDTDHAHGVMLQAKAVVELVQSMAGRCHWVVLTGGEPLLHLDEELVEALQAHHFCLALETNGTLPLRFPLDWVAVSPKRGTALAVRRADEVKVVLAAGDPIPDLTINADYHLLSPAFEGGTLPEANLQHCIRLCMENPRWRLSCQQHKAIWGVR